MTLGSQAEQFVLLADGSYNPRLGSSSRLSLSGGAPANLPSQIFYPSNPTLPFVSNSYDTLGRVATQSNAVGATWNYFFAGYRSEENDANGTQHVIYYNPRGKPVFDIQDAAGLNRVTATVYDGLDRLSTVTPPEGGGTSWTYDTAVNPWANNVATVTRNPKPGSLLSPTITSYVYEPTFNKPTRVTDALGRVTLVEYDYWTGDALSVTTDAGAAPHFNARSRLTYNTLGLVTSATDPMGTLTTYAYDDLGNRLSVTADAGPGRLNQTASSTYNARGDVVSATDPKGNTATSTYDDARRLITATSPTSSAAPAGVVTTNTYDPDGRLLQAQQAAGGSVLRAISSTYTPTGKVATTTDARGNVTRYAYDPLERLANVTDAEGRIAQFTYDALSRPYRTYNTAIQAGPLVQRTYTADGLLATLADGNGNTTGFAYDGFDRLMTTTYPLGSTEAFTYDALDNVLTLRTRAGGTPIAYAYDTLNRLVTKTPPSGPVVTYGYDLNSRPTGVGDNSAAIVAAVPPSGSTITFGMAYAYDALNRLTGTTWDPAPAATAPTAGPLVTFGHVYNKVNQRIGQTVDDNTWLSYPAATPATTAYTANSLNQYTAVGAVMPTYDANGNLTSDGTYTLGYDLENRLTSANGAGNTASYAFDGRGRRKSRTVNGTTTISVTDADNREVLEYDGSTGAALRWYAYGLGPNAVLNQMNIAGGTRATLLPDQLGSIIASFASGTGALTKFGYQPYGNSAAAATPFGYTGQRFDQESGLYYYRARHYSTKWGRFLQADPIGYAGGPSLYAYVGNDPLNGTDPTGLASDYSSGGSGGGWDWGGASASTSSPAIAPLAPTYDPGPIAPVGGPGPIAPLSPPAGGSGTTPLAGAAPISPPVAPTVLSINPGIGGGGGGGDPSPSGPSGSSVIGPLQPPPVVAPGWQSQDQSPIQLAGDITGFTKHGINQSINRGVSPAAILDAVVNPLQILPQANGTVRYVGSGAVVVLNPAGRVVTVWGQ